MKKNYYKSFIVLLVVIFITVLSCSRDDSEDEQVPNIPNTTTPTNDTNPKDNGNILDTTNDTAINNNPNYSLYNLYQAQSFMHWLNPTDICSVGYDIYPYKKLRSKECGIESERHECKSCRHPDFGIESDQTISQNHFRKDYPVQNTKGADPNMICTSHIQEIKTELKNNKNNSNFLIYVNFVSGYFINFPQPVVEAVHNYSIMTHTLQNASGLLICNYLIELKKPRYNEMKNCNICGAIDETIYKLCRHPANGKEETISKSSLNMSKKDVQNLEGEIISCKTCDDIKFDILNMDENNDTQLVNRINCLLNNLDSSDTNNEDKQ